MIASISDIKLAIVGLGYVGLPLAVEFGKSRHVFGFDINTPRINSLNSLQDITLEVSSAEIQESTGLAFTNSLEAIRDSNCYIVTVPTPINDINEPDLGPLISASQSIGSILNDGDIVIFESTVFPGATEEICVPQIEQASGLTFNKNFFVGYSPERINPGDKLHRLPDIMKVTSGSTPEISIIVDELYKSIIKAGTHRASSIKIAEAAKVIENTQRDLNIALVNELALIFNKLDIDTEEVLEAAGTKWNFLPFRPGLVGGHCIGVDPYYLTHKAQQIGYDPEIILAGRRLNDSMSSYVSLRLQDEMIKRNIKFAQSNILVLGATFKENCPDLRNSKIIDVITSLKNLGANVSCYDPWIDESQYETNLNFSFIKKLPINHFDAIIIAVSHSEFIEMGADAIHALGKNPHLVYDLKYVLPASASDLRL
jgi:UDP-N-acetyl-D-galactosamine dehydrogenase|tara:strand:+ start:482 stop:1762 length:1281 start_codon:yes stop_codon:yes gene_type:complete